MKKRAGCLDDFVEIWDLRYPEILNLDKKNDLILVSIQVPREAMVLNLFYQQYRKL